jgi:CRISPR-associated exonuclease Cas4
VYSEDDLIPISGLQHLQYCERQFALIHVEQIWEDNRFTAEGEVLHERVDAEGHESRRLYRQEFGMAVRSLELGLIGKCDLVELYLRPEGGVAEAVPVEFKRGKAKEDDRDLVQLCAQALCLEEMLGVAVARGDFYYLGAHRRTHAEISVQLREVTKSTIARARDILESGSTPVAEYEPRKCDRCSLVEDCMPKAVGGGGKRVSRYLQAGIAAARKECSQ